jgi:hypothetical protein
LNDKLQTAVNDDAEYDELCKQVKADIPDADADINLQLAINASLGVELLAPMETENNDADNDADLQFAIEASVDSNRFVISLTIFY